MAHGIVMIFADDNGEKVETPVWHLVDPNLADPATLCQGEFFGPGQSNCVFENKEVKKGGITCPLCLAQIKALKAVRL